MCFLFHPCSWCIVLGYIVISSVYGGEAQWLLEIWFALNVTHGYSKNWRTVAQSIAKLSSQKFLCQVRQCVLKAQKFPIKYEFYGKMSQECSQVHWRAPHLPIFNSYWKITWCGYFSSIKICLKYTQSGGYQLRDDNLKESQGISGMTQVA